jgi:histidine phosphotransferase ChpT
MVDDDIKICELLQAKFCHDMAGTLSAINNSVEFLSSSNNNLREKATTLIQTSAAESVAKLQFYRTAYGSALDNGETSFEEIISIINNFASYTKVNIMWPASTLAKLNTPITNRLAKIVLNLLLVISDSLIYGGTINIKCDSKNNKSQIIINAAGKKCLLEDKYLSIILNPDINIDHINVDNIQEYIIARLIKIYNAELSIRNKTGESIEFVLYYGLN